MAVSLALILCLTCPQDPASRASQPTARSVFEELAGKERASSTIPGLTGAHPVMAARNQRILAAIAANPQLFATGEGAFWRGRIQVLGGQSVEGAGSLLAYADDPTAEKALANEARGRAALALAGTNKPLAAKLAKRVDRAALDATLRAELEGAFPTTRPPKLAGPLDGKPLPPLLVEKVLGGPDDLTLDQLKNNVLVIEFYATWCGPCRASIAALARLQEEKKHLGLQVIGVTTLYGMGIDYDPESKPGDSGTAVRNLDAEAEYAVNSRFMKSLGFNYPVIVTSKDTPLNQFHVKAIPTLVVVGRDGNVVGSLTGANEEALAALLDEALAVPMGGAKKR